MVNARSVCGVTTSVVVFSEEPLWHCSSCRTLPCSEPPNMPSVFSATRQGSFRNTKRLDLNRRPADGNQLFR
jgi:hypothetical protein